MRAFRMVLGRGACAPQTRTSRARLKVVQLFAALLAASSGAVMAADVEDTDDDLIEKIAAAVAGKLRISGPNNSLSWAGLWQIYEQEADSEHQESWNTTTGRAKHIVRVIGHEAVED